MDTTKTLLKKIDFIGQELKPSIGGNSIVATSMGGLLSILIGLASIAAFIFFGEELIMREKPIARTYSRIDTTLSQETSSFPFLLGIFSSEGVNISYEEEVLNDFILTGNILSFRKNEKGENVPSVITVPVVLCSRSIIGDEYSDKHASIGFDVSKFFCMDMSSIPKDQRRVAQVLGTPGSSTLRLQVGVCDPKKVKNCGKTFEKFGKLNIGVAFYDKFVDLTSFSNPIQENLLNFLIPLSNKIEALIRFKINNNILSTDEGIIFSIINEKKFITIENYERNFSDFKEAVRMAVVLDFQANIKETITERQYLKIQELLAEIGGFINGIMFVCQTINTFNSEVTLINHVKQIEFTAAKSTPFNIKFLRHENNTIQQNNVDSRINLQPDKFDETQLIGVWAFLKNILTCKLKINSALKQNAESCLDLEELIKQREFIRALKQKLEEQ